MEVIMMKYTRFSFIFFSFSFCLLLSSCYSFFQGKVSMNSDGNTSDLTSLVTDKTVITKLDAPSQIFVSDGLYAGQIEISWSAVSGAASYRLERAVVVPSGDGTYSEPDESEYDIIRASSTNTVSSDYISGTSYTDYLLVNPVYTSPEYTYRYYYRVSAENAYKKYDSSDFVTSPAGTLFAPPSSVKASLGDSTSYIKVTWKKSANASFYKIYRSTNSDGTNGVYLESVTSNQNWYSDSISSAQQGIEYYYTVLAQNSSGNTSTSSSIALGYALVEGAPSRVTGVTVSNGRGSTVAKDGITITWNRVASTGGYTTTYNVYRTSSADSTYMFIKTIDNSAETPSCTDKQSLKPNIYYYYQVQCVMTGITDTTKVIKGPFSSSSAADTSPAEGYLLSAPVSLTVSKVPGTSPTQCRFTFPAAIGSESCTSNSGIYTDYNTYTYKIFGGTTADLQDKELSFTLPESSLGLYTVNIPTGDCSFFKIVTVNGSLESSGSSTAAPAPYSPKSASASQHAYFSGGSYSDGSAYTFEADSSGVYPVKITWSAPDEGADGGYYIYRSTKSTESFRKINETPVTDLYYIDSNDTAKTGTYYYYKILSLNSLGQGTNFSNVCTGYGALTYDQYMREYNKTIKQSQKKLTLMHKSGSTAKLGSETINGDIGGTLYYNASVQGLGGRVIMKYTDYADYYISSDSALGYYFFVNGNTNTTASMDASGTMDGTVTCTGMYPGTVGYDNIKIIGGAANGGYYVIHPEGIDAGNVSYTVGNE